VDTGKDVTTAPTVTRTIEESSVRSRGRSAAAYPGAPSAPCRPRAS